MSFIPSMFKSAPQPKVSAFAPGNTDVVITSVNVNNTVIVPAGIAAYDASGFACGNGSAYLSLLNATHVRVVSYIGLGDARFTVLEYNQGFLRQPVQYGVITFLGGSPTALSATAAITAVGSKAYVIHLGLTQDTNAAQADMASVTSDIVLTSTVLLTATRYGQGGVSGFPDNAKLGFCVVDPR